MNQFFHMIQNKRTRENETIDFSSDAEHELLLKNDIIFLCITNSLNIHGTTLWLQKDAKQKNPRFFIYILGRDSIFPLKKIKIRIKI